MKPSKYALPVAAAACLIVGVPSFADTAAEGATIFAKPTSSGTEHLSGTLSLSGHAGKGKSASHELMLHVTEHHGKAKTHPNSMHGKSVKLVASGGVLKELHKLAHEHAHVKVSGTLSGDTMTVTSVSAHHGGK